MKAKHKSGLAAMLDYGTVEESKGVAEPIYVYKDEGLTENNITLSVEEAKWLIKELQYLVKALEGKELL